jgi:D-inositol-3-phosphate glycosyltransferase
MSANSLVTESPAQQDKAQIQPVNVTREGIEIGLLTGCQDRPYAFGLAMALALKGATLEVIGSGEIDSPEFHTTPNLRFFDFIDGQKSRITFWNKLSNVIAYYAKIMRYAARSKPKILHILWNYKFEYFDRTILMLYFKALGKKIFLTAHNVNQAKRDLNDSWLNRATLKIQYRLCDHIFVHTQKMKLELCQDFHVTEKAVTVIQYPIDNSFPDTELTPAGAKRRIGLRDEEKAILFFGRIRPYKGLEFLLEAFRLLLADKCENYRLVVAGEPKKGSEEYLGGIQRLVETNFASGQVIQKIEFIPDRDVELYFKAADVLVLPYKEIFQSGVLFLSFGYGLPVVATDVGSFREEIVEGRTGFLCKPGDPAELAKALATYFASDLYKDLTLRRQEIKDYANATHSSYLAAELTCDVYKKVLAGNRT